MDSALLLITLEYFIIRIDRVLATMFIRVSMNKIGLSHSSDNNYCKSAEVPHLNRHVIEKYDIDKKKPV